MTTVHTVGHGTLPSLDFAELVRGAHLDQIVDIRSFPGSRRNPHFGTDEMACWLPEGGVSYSWVRDLGGRRRPMPESRHVALRHPSFRAYADYMETEPFLSAVEDLLASHAEGAAVMCSETVWWRCHRRLLADHLQLVRGVEVRHLMHDGRLTPHGPTGGVRVDGDRLIYDVGATPPLGL